MPDKPKIRYAANDADIARALGLRPTPEKLYEVQDWRTWDDFPQRTDKGYVIDDLRAWAESNAAEFAKRKSLAAILDIDQPYKASELKLVQTTAKTSGNTPKEVQGLTAMAALIAGHFKIQCTKQYIARWRKQTPEPFPPPDANSNRFNVGECFAWVNKWILSKAKTEDSNLFHRQAEANAQNDIEALEHDRWQRDKERGEYIKRDVASRTTIGVIRTYHGFVKAELERRSVDTFRDKCRELSVPAEMAQNLCEYILSQRIEELNRIEARCDVEASRE